MGKLWMIIYSTILLTQPYIEIGSVELVKMGD